MTFSNANNATFNLQAQYRGGVYTKADVASWIKQQWATMVRRNLDQDLLMRRWVMSVSFPDGKFGDRVTIPTLGRLGVNTKVAATPVVLQKNTPGNYQVLVDQYKEVSYMIEDLTEIFLDPSGLLANNLAKEAAYALARDIDANILALRAAIQNLGGSQVIINSADGTLTGNSRPFTLDAFLKAKLALDVRDVDPSSRVLIVSPVQFTQLLALDKVQSMFYRTSAPLESGIVGTLLGVPVYMTSMIQANSATGFLNGTTAIPTPGVTGAGQIYYPTQDTSTTLPVAFSGAGNVTADQQAVHTALMLSKESFAIAMLQEPRVEVSRETLYLADAAVTSTLYGVKTYRPETAVIIHTNSTIPAV